MLVQDSRLRTNRQPGRAKSINS
uniref:Uncharacterized protein n=1 Tax=Arundo donax TaxID=35708 RepID=A0A0A9CDF9_ARUDO